MPTPAIDVLAARLGECCYLPPFLLNPIDVRPAVEALGRKLVDIIMGKEPVLGIVPFGIITDGPDGKIATLRGTQEPMGDKWEWWNNFQAVLVPTPLTPSARWHEGFGALSETLYVGRGEPLGHYLADERIEIVSGHSLGGPIATAAAAEAGCDLLIIIESPNPGDFLYREWVQGRVKTIRSYWNPRDIIGKVPFDVPNFEAFVGIADKKILLDPNCVTPPVEDSLWQNHSLTNCRRMMESAA